MKQIFFIAFTLFSTTAFAANPEKQLLRFESGKTYSFAVHQKTTGFRGAEFYHAENNYIIRLTTDSVVGNNAHCQFTILPAQGEDTSHLLSRQRLMPQSGTLKITPNGGLESIRINSYYNELTEDDKDMMKRYRVTDKRAFTLNTGFSLPTEAPRNVNIGEEKILLDSLSPDRTYIHKEIAKRLNDTLFTNGMRGEHYILSEIKQTERSTFTPSSERHSFNSSDYKATLIWSKEQSLPLYFERLEHTDDRASMYYQRGNITSGGSESLYILRLLQD